MVNTCVVIPIYTNNLMAHEATSLVNNLKVLKKYTIFLVKPNSLILTNPLFLNSRAEIKNFSDVYFENINGYNKLLLSVQFYEAFEAFDKMLICQLDAYVFNDHLDYWSNKNFDYIGAPWFWACFTGNAYNMAKTPMPYGGNGGFSLRNISQCIAVLKSIKSIKFNYKIKLKKLRIKHVAWPKKIVDHVLIFCSNIFSPKLVTINQLISESNLNEDCIWALAAPLYTDFKVANFDEATPFAFEMYPEELYKLNNNNLPFGAHAWQKYNKTFFDFFIK